MESRVSLIFTSKGILHFFSEENLGVYELSEVGTYLISSLEISKMLKSSSSVLICKLFNKSEFCFENQI